MMVSRGWGKEKVERCNGGRVSILQDEKSSGPAPVAYTCNPSYLGS
jgi:hypothetical protein